MISTIVAMALAASPQPDACSWARPGVNRYRGDPVAALSDYAFDDATRTKLRAMMAARQFTDIAVITRDDIAGKERYGNLRDMHSGHGQVCRGPVDRSAWTAQHEERGLVYCVDDACVIVPTVCNNVSLVTRRGSEAIAPIDIEPAAGPAATDTSALAEVPASAEVQLGDIVPSELQLPLPPAIASSDMDWTPVPAVEPWKSCCDDAIPAPPLLGWPVTTSPGAGNGSGLPIGPTSAVPEPPAWALVLAGFAAFMRRALVLHDLRRWCASRSGLCPSGRLA